MSRSIGLAITLLVAALCVPSAHAQSAMPYAEVCFAQPGEAVLDDLARAGIALDHAHRTKTAAGPEVCAVLNSTEQVRLDGAGVAYRVEVPDLAEAFAATLTQRQAQLEAARSQAFDLERFEFGFVGGFYAYDEIEDKLDQLRADFPDLITEKVSLGTTGEGRDVWMAEISDNPGVDEGEPEVLYTALHHAREPQSMATIVYFMVYLLEKYETDPEVRYLVDNRRLVFVPVVNPDGYAYNEQTDPFGGGLWRKNRRDNGDGTFGVDLNRNYGFEWGRDNRGSSPDGFSGTYRGAAPFSEPETAAMRDFVESRRFETALNYHSRGNLLIYPWGYEPDLYTADSARFVDIADQLTLANSYTAGTVNQVLGYIVNGSSDDWMYGEQTAKPPILAYTPEVNDRELDGFWTPPERIELRAQENIDANLIAAWVAGGFPVARLASPYSDNCKVACNQYVDPGNFLLAFADIENIGSGPLDADVRVVSTSPLFDVGSSWFAQEIEPGEQRQVEVNAQVSEDAPLGLAEGLAVEVRVGEAIRTLPLPPVLIGTPAVVFEDEANTLDAWTTEGSTVWGLANVVDAAPTAFTDSPTGAYRSSTRARLQSAEPLDLSEAAQPFLSFDTRWDIEPEWDVAQVLVSTDGVGWEAQPGQYTEDGSGQGTQEVGSPGYDGTQSAWVREVIDLAAYAGQPEVYIAFELRSDESVEADGWYVDNVEVSYLVRGVDVGSEGEDDLPRFALAVPYPNPSAGAVQIALTLPTASAARVEVFDVLGRRVAVLAEGERTAGRHTLAWDGRDASGRALGAGTYVVRLTADGQVQTQTFVRMQ